MTAQEAFQAGQLSEALKLATDSVRNNPTDTDSRSFLAVLLCFAGEWERADKQLDSVNIQKTEMALGVSLLRQLIRAEQARDGFYREGRAPELTAEPPQHLELALRALIELRDGQSAAANDLLAQSEEVRPEFNGTHNGQTFSGIRDLDDLLSGVCEVLTSNGKFYLVPWQQIRLLEFKAPEKPLDLLWRQARMVIEDGPDGEIYIPVLYHGSSETDDEQIRMGRASDWVGDEAGPIRGLGQRLLLIGEDDVPVLSIGTIEREESQVDDEDES